MIDAAERSGVKLMEAFMYRLHPLWVEVRMRGAVGELRAIQAFFSYHNIDPEDIRNRVDAGGGSLHDIGCYPVNVARMLFDAEPSDVISSIRRDPDFGTDVLTSVILAFDGRRDFHLLDPVGRRSASSHLRDCGSARRRDPVQHPAGSSHPRPVGIR